MAEVYMIVGFLLAAYAIIGNDSIQTLGTFLHSNSHRPWWVLWIFSSTILLGVVAYGWMNYDQDPSYHRLNKVYDKSVSLSDSLEKIEIAQAAMEAEPEQSRIIAELEALKTTLEVTKSTFVKDPPNLDAAIAELQFALSEVQAEIGRVDVPHPQKVNLQETVDAVNAVIIRMEERRDVSQFINWKYLLPPLVLLFLTRFGFPVSTSFLVLVTFQPAVMESMLLKSLMGYVVAMVVAILVYTLVMRALENRWKKEGEAEIKPIWVVFQWCSTGFLWSMWLIQDMANIFVYLPRRPEFAWLLFGVLWMVAVQGFIYYSKGGKIQQVVTSKTNTHDIRSATIVDLIYGVVLYYFKIQNPIPMSTTWVFLGLLAGREIAFAIARSEGASIGNAFKLARKDMVKAGFGLGVSVIIALLINQI